MTKYRSQQPKELPAYALHCPFAPFQTLFPHCAAVVHHGGIGTVANALAAGLPQLVRPICFDQQDNGARIKRLGAGDVLTPASATGRQIAKALAPLLEVPARTQCRKWAPHFASSDPFLLASDLVEELAAPSRPTKKP